VCNASFEDNVRQRLKGALARDAYEEVLDPRASACLGSMAPATRRRSTDSARPPSRCRRSAAALGMLGADENVANEAAETLKRRRAEQEGASVRGDMV